MSVANQLPQCAIICDYDPLTWRRAVYTCAESANPSNLEAVQNAVLYNPLITDKDLADVLFGKLSPKPDTSKLSDVVPPGRFLQLMGCCRVWLETIPKDQHSSCLYDMHIYLPHKLNKDLGEIFERALHVLEYVVVDKALPIDTLVKEWAHLAFANFYANADLKFQSMLSIFKAAKRYVVDQVDQAWTLEQKIQFVQRVAAAIDVDTSFITPGGIVRNIDWCSLTQLCQTPLGNVDFVCSLAEFVTQRVMQATNRDELQGMHTWRSNFRACLTFQQVSTAEIDQAIVSNPLISNAALLRVHYATTPYLLSDTATRVPKEYLTCLLGCFDVWMLKLETDVDRFAALDNLRLALTNRTTFEQTDYDDMFVKRPFKTSCH